MEETVGEETATEVVNSEISEISVSEPDLIILDEDYNVEPHFTELKNIFPNVDPEYIRQICIDPPFDDSEGDRLVMLINHLLSYDDSFDENMIVQKYEGRAHQEFSGFVDEQQFMLEQTVKDQEYSHMLQIQDLQEIEKEKENENLLQEQLFNEFLQQDQEMIVEKTNILVDMLPDANPEYLRQIVEQNKEDVTSLEQIVESKLIHRDYEKRDKYFAGMKTREKIEQYTINFDVKKYLEQIPEPLEFFDNPKRQCTYQENALEFLKNRYYMYPESHVCTVYNNKSYNLSLADKYLLGQSEAVPPLNITNIQFDDVPLLQEIAFIQNRNMIEEIDKKEKKEIEQLKAKKLLLECQCCYDSEVKPTEIYECENNHLFCKKCIIKGTELAIANGKTLVQCFQECNKEISLDVLRKVILPETFDLFLKKRQEHEVMAAKLDGLVTCPFCPYSMEVPPQIQIFTCKNPECMKITCCLCKKMNHLPIKCDDVVDEHKGRLYVEEEMTRALIRYCNNCQLPFVKLDGCNKMTCYKCGAMMCYICKSPINGYEHFNNGRCKTHQNSDIYDREQVELRRAAATTELLSQNPQLKVPKI